MAPTSRYRDVIPSDELTLHDAREGRSYIAVIGVDQYREWGQLQNAVRDARGALSTFVKLGFEQVIEPLLNEAATGEALRRLVTDDLSKLGTNDSLVLFFAGHGHTVTNSLAEGARVKTGYLIPVDADSPGGRIATWLRVDTWLNDVSRLPPKHILVILDACHSGIALDPLIRWRGEGGEFHEPLEELRMRRSRRIFTSALDGQLAADDGPVHGHSLFTGCLIEALAGGFFYRTGQSQAIGSDIWSHVRRRVIDFPGSKQTPGLGAFDLHNHGDLVVELFRPAPQRLAEPNARGTRTAPSAAATAVRTSHVRARSGGRRSAVSWQSRYDAGLHGGGPVSRVDGSLLDAAFVAALDRQDAERRRSGTVLSVVAGNSIASLADWAAWAAGRGYLTLVTEGAGLDAAIEDLLMQMPWLRCLAMARRRLAVAAQLDVEAIDAALDARAAEERREWIDELAGLDQEVRVSGWLLSALREPSPRAPDLATAPARGGELLALLCELATPIAVLVHHPESSVPWLERAISTAAALLAYLPGHPIAVGAPSEIVTRVLGGDRQSAALSMARQGVVPTVARPSRAPNLVRDRMAQTLHAALDRDLRMGGLFEQRVQVPIPDGGPSVDVDLVARAERLAVVIDGWYHHADPQAYRRDRGNDVRLQRAGYFVMRFTTEDIGERLALVVNEIAIGLGGRRASSGFHEGSLW